VSKWTRSHDGLSSVHKRDGWVISQVEELIFGTDRCRTVWRCHHPGARHFLGTHHRTLAEAKARVDRIIELQGDDTSLETARKRKGNGNE